MLASRSFALALASTSLVVGACATDTQVPDELAGTTAADGVDDGKADASGTYTYFEVAPDLRKCASPMCGGLWVSRANLATTRCADGVYRDACYVAALDLSAIGLADGDLAKASDAARQGDARLLVRGRIASRTYGGVGRFGVLVGSEAWLGGTDSSPDGVLVKVRDNGVRCFAAPCPSLAEDKLDSSRTANIAGLDFTPSGASDKQIEAATALTATGDLIVAGDRYTITVEGRHAKGRTVTQYWTRLAPAAP